MPRDIESHLYEHEGAKWTQDKVISGQERSLVAKLFGKTEKDISDLWDKRWLDAEQKQSWNKNNALNKQNEEYNRSLNKVKEQLNNHETIAKLLEMMKNQIDHIQHSNEIQHYRAFIDAVKWKENIIHASLDKMKNQNQARDAQEKLFQSLEDLSWKLDHKQTELEEKEKSPPVTSNRAEGGELQTIDSSALQSQLSQLDQKDFEQFGEVMKNLLTGKVSVEQLDPLDKMTQLITLIAKTDPAIVQQAVEKIIEDNKDKIWNDQILRETVSQLLKNKPILQQFVNIVDKEVRWLSYDNLLQAKDLTTADAKKAINTLFYRDESMFNRLITDFSDESKKGQVQNIVKEYITLQLPDKWLDEELSAAVMSVEDLKVNGTMKKGFVFKDTQWNDITFKDNQWQDKPLTPFFGDATEGKALSIANCVNQNKWYKEAMGIGADNMKELPGMKALMESGNLTINGERMSFGNAIQGLFNHPMLRAIWKNILWILAQFGDSEKKRERWIDYNFEQSYDMMVAWWNWYKEKYPDPAYINLKPYDLGEKVRKYPFSTNGETSHKPWSEKHFFTALTTEEQIAYIVDPKKRQLLQVWKSIDGVWTNSLGKSQNEFRTDQSPKETVASSQTTTTPENSTNTLNVDNTNKSKSKESIENFVDWDYKALSINDKLPGKLEKKWDWENKYCLIDWQVVPYNGFVFVKHWDKIQLVKVAVNDWMDSASLDKEYLNTIIDKNNLYNTDYFNDNNKFYWLQYYALGQSVDDKNPNPIDGFMTELNTLNPRPEWMDQAIATMKKELQALEWEQRTEANIKAIFKTGKTTIETEINTLEEWKQTPITEALTSWSKAVGIDQNTESDA